MIVTVTIVIGLVTGIAFATASIARHGEAPVIDPALGEHRLVRLVSRHPRLAAFVARRLDRGSAGGSMLSLGFLAVLGLSLLAAWIFDSLDENRGFARYDEAVAEWGARHATDTTTTLLELFTALGGTEVVTVVAVVVAVYGWRRYGTLRAAGFMLAVAAGQSLINNGIKWIVSRERPAIAQLAGWAGSSFPSGHSAAAAAVWAAVALLLGAGAVWWVRSLFWGAAICIATGVAVTRVLLGVHWLTDVIAGLAVGWAWFVIVAVAFRGSWTGLGDLRHTSRDQIAPNTARRPS